MCVALFHLLVSALHLFQNTHKEDTMENKERTAMVGALMLVAGGIIGAGAALLLAPQSGEKTRRDLARYARKVKRQAGDVAGEFADSVSDMVETVADKGAELAERGKELAQDARREIMKSLEDGQERLEKERKRLQKLFS
jgi:gas vesicle protein